tara:strand:+ start:4591 stop:5772 length:1182 start_codon:yes stop_codon:yes gene_type:complete
MRVIVCGDCHIGAVFGLGKQKPSGRNTRVDDYEKSLNYIVDYAIDTKADVFVQTGDIFEHRNPDPEHIDIVDKALKKLSSAGVVTAVIMGNHDYRKNGESFTSSITSIPAKDSSNVRVVINPEVMAVSNDKGECVNIVLLPYRDRRMYEGKNNKEQSVHYNNEIKDLIDSCLITPDPSPCIAIGHNFFYEGSYNDYGGAEVLAEPSSFEGCDIAMMGHLHQFRVLKKKSPICLYTGSMEKTNFGDATVDKYFIDYDTSERKPKICKTPVRDLLDFTVNLEDCDFSNFNQKIIDEISKKDLKEKIVRLKILTKEALVPALDKQKISKILYRSNAFYVSKIIIEQISERIIRDSSVLAHKDDYSMFKAFIESQNVEEEMAKAVLREAKDIMSLNS